MLTYASYLIPALRELGHEVYVLAGEKAPDFDDGYTVDLEKAAPGPTLWGRVVGRLSGDSYRRRRAFADGVRKLRSTYGFELVEMEDAFGSSLEISRAAELPVVVRLHGPFFLNGQFDHDLEHSREAQTRIAREGIAIAAASAISAPSQSVLALTARRYGRLPGMQRVIPNATPMPADGAAWSAASADRRLLLFVGRFDRHKGGDVVLRAFAELCARDRELKLVFAGADIGVPQKLKDFLRSPAFDHARDRIEYAGTLDAAAIRRLRLQAYLTIVASRYETFCLALTEAMAAGCPVVATAAGAIPEIVQHDRNGLLVPPDDPSALAAACRQLLDDPAAAARLGRQAREDCRAKYDPRRLAADTADFFAAALDAFRAR